MNTIPLPTITLMSAHDTTATYSIEPLAPGYGWTVGSVLQHTLRRSLSGPAITALRISGWSPGSEQLPGVKETVSELVLNCKQVRVQQDEVKPHQFTLYLEAAGKHIITAHDIVVPYGLEIVTPNVYLATLTHEQASLSMELLGETGKGYVPADARAESLPPGAIPIDAIYTPVRRVTYAIEAARVGSLVNYQKVVLTITTDGTISPEAALRRSAAILVQHYSLFAAFDRQIVQLQSASPDAVAIRPDIDALPLEQIGLPLRTYNSLKRSGLSRVGQVLCMSEEDLRGIRNFGEQAFQHLVERIVALNLLPAPNDLRVLPETDDHTDQERRSEGVQQT